MSKASVIAGELAARVDAISTASGYATNIGATVYRGRLKLEESLLPCVVMVEGDDEVLDAAKNEFRKVKVSRPFMFEGHMICDPDNPNDTAHQIITDLKKAIFTPSAPPTGVSAMRYVRSSLAPREDGANIVAASIDIEVEYVEDLAAP